MFFSVLIANYNNCKYLTQAIESVKTQTFQDWEIVLVDDGSTDDSRIVIESLRDERFKIEYTSINKGVAYTKHRCVELASGEICGFLDPDDALATNALQIMADQFVLNRNSSIIYSDHYACDENLAVLHEVKQDRHTIETFMMCKTPNHFTAFSKAAYFKAGGIKPQLKRAVDRDLCLRLEEVGAVSHVPELLYYYRMHNESISNNNNRLKAGYWTWMVRFDACDRRGWNTEEWYSKIMLERDERIMQLGRKKVWETIDYKIGNGLLSPIRTIKGLLRS